MIGAPFTVVDTADHKLNVEGYLMLLSNKASYDPDSPRSAGSRRRGCCRGGPLRR